MEGFPSGQRDQTVNLTRKLRWFESTPLHHEGWIHDLGGLSVVGGYSSMVERQPSKLNMRVRSSLPAPMILRRGDRSDGLDRFRWALEHRDVIRSTIVTLDVNRAELGIEVKKPALK